MSAQPRIRVSAILRWGDRIAQLVVLPAPPVSPREVAELPASERGERGFGSSS